MAGFCCRGALFDAESNELIKHNDAVITDVNILKSLLLDCTIWSRDPESWKLQFTIFNSLVDERHKYREFNLRTLIDAEAVLRLLETLQITLSERPELEISVIVADTMIELIRALIGYPPDTKIISRVFDFCCAIHPPAEAYVTNTRKKFYFYPQFEKSNDTKSMQAKMERSQSLDVLEQLSPKSINSAPKRIRTMNTVTKRKFSFLQKSIFERQIVFRQLFKSGREGVRTSSTFLVLWRSSQTRVDSSLRPLSRPLLQGALIRTGQKPFFAKVDGPE